MYRRNSILAPLRTEVSVADLQHLDVLRRLIEEMPVCPDRHRALTASAIERPTIVSMVPCSIAA
jgi:hypothetical protein